MLPDLQIPRIQLNNHDALRWAADGSMAFNTAGQLTILSPRYTKSEIKTSMELFKTVTVDLESLSANALYNAEMPDERTGTTFTSAGQAVTKIEWSPLVDNCSLLGVLTTHHSVLVVKDGELWRDLTTKKEIKTQTEFDQNKTHSIGWLKSEDDVLLVEGLASGHIRTIDPVEIEERDFIKVCDSPIVMIKIVGDVIFAVSSKNEIFRVEGSKVEQWVTADRFMVYDLYTADSKTIYYTTCGKITKISNKEPTVTESGIQTPAKIHPNSTTLLLISQTKTLALNDKLQQIPCETLEPILRKRVAKWNAKFNDFNTKRASLEMYGSDLNFDGNVLAVLYDIEEDARFKYKIASENVFKVCFVPLKNDFNAEGSSLAVFQEYKMSGYRFHTQPESKTPNYKADFETFLKEDVVKNPELLFLASQNLVSCDQDELIKKKYAELVLGYISKNKLKFDNLFDRAVLNNLNLVAGKKSNVPVKDVVISCGSFSETFDFNKDQNPESMVSHTENEWATCSLTFLPVLTTHVKVDPVTERRFIDVDRDTWNDYGPLTKTLLTCCGSGVSIYSGCRYTLK